SMIRLVEGNTIVRLTLTHVQTLLLGISAARTTTRDPAAVGSQTRVLITNGVHPAIDNGQNRSADHLIQTDCNLSGLLLGNGRSMELTTSKTTLNGSIRIRQSLLTETSDRTIHVLHHMLELHEEG